MFCSKIFKKVSIVYPLGKQVVFRQSNPESHPLCSREHYIYFPLIVLILNVYISALYFVFTPLSTGLNDSNMTLHLPVMVQNIDLLITPWVTYWLRFNAFMYCLFGNSFFTMSRMNDWPGCWTWQSNTDSFTGVIRRNRRKRPSWQIPQARSCIYLASAAPVSCQWLAASGLSSPKDPTVADLLAHLPTGAECQVSDVSGECRGMFSFKDTGAVYCHQCSHLSLL